MANSSEESIDVEFDDPDEFDEEEDSRLEEE
jgi:hypothetical protein